MKQFFVFCVVFIPAVLAIVNVRQLTTGVHKCAIRVNLKGPIDLFNCETKNKNTRCFLKCFAESFGMVTDDEWNLAETIKLFKFIFPADIINEVINAFRECIKRDYDCTTCDGVADAYNCHMNMTRPLGLPTLIIP